MKHSMRCIHTCKDDFLYAQASKKANAKTNALAMELVKKQKGNDETQDGTWTPSKKWCEMNAWRNYISHMIGVSKEFDADFTFPKIHLMHH
jgi:hypothetical protein